MWAACYTRKYVLEQAVQELWSSVGNCKIVVHHLSISSACPSNESIYINLVINFLTKIYKTNKLLSLNHYNIFFISGKGKARMVSISLRSMSLGSFIPPHSLTFASKYMAVLTSESNYFLWRCHNEN